MSEAVETTPGAKSAVANSQAGLGMAERHGPSGASSYGDVLFEYAAVREGGAGVVDLSSRGCLLVNGSEAIQFLNGLITNDMKTLAENRWMPAVFPNVQGRLVASVRVIRRNDGFLIDTEAATHDRVLQTVGRFTGAGDFRVADLTEQTTLLSVQGAKAGVVVRAVLGDAAAMTAESDVAVVAWRDSDVTIIHATHTAADGFDLFVGVETATALWDALTVAGARPVGLEAFEILRIEAGQPRFGIDMDESNVVTETNLDDAISYTKGCYIGQEIVARIKYRGHVAKKLTGIMCEQAVKIEPGATIRSLEDKEIGRITSATLSPHLGRTVALGYVKYDFLAPRTRVKVASADRVALSQVVELPFVCRSGSDR